MPRADPLPAAPTRRSSGAGPALVEDGRVNPGYLKLDLMCRGLRLDEGLRLDGRQGPVRMRSGLGSGLELRLPGPERIHANVPVLEPFAAESPYRIEGPDARGRYRLFRDGRLLTHVLVPPRPRFLDRTTSSGLAMEAVGVVQGTYLGVYYGPLCASWKVPERDACRFCSLGASVREGAERTGKSVRDVVETALAARHELGITFVHVNGGFDDSRGYVERFLPLVEALRRETGLLIGLQVPPLDTVEEYVRLRRAGVKNASLCFEVWDPDRFEEVCPGKHARAGLDRFRQAITWCAQEARFATTNGEMIAGLEPVESSMAAVDWLTATGAVPTICVFRPVAGSRYADREPPRTEDLVPLFAHAWHRVLERGLPVGVAPGIHVSIVLTPEEWRWLLPPAERERHPWRRLRLLALRGAFRAGFALQRALRRPPR